MNLNEIRNEISTLKILESIFEKDLKSYSFNQQVFIKYVDLNNVTKVAKFFRDNNIKLPNGNSIQPNHIKDIIRSTPRDVDSYLVQYAHKISNKNDKLSRKIGL